MHYWGNRIPSQKFDVFFSRGAVFKFRESTFRNYCRTFLLENRTWLKVIWKYILNVYVISKDYFTIWAAWTIILLLLWHFVLSLSNRTEAKFSLSWNLPHNYIVHESVFIQLNYWVSRCSNWLCMRCLQYYDIYQNDSLVKTAQCLLG